MQGAGEGLPGNDGPPTLLFDISKRGQGASQKQGCKELLRKLKAEYKVIMNEDMITPEILQGVSACMFYGPKDKFTEVEFEALKQYMENGGSVMFFIGEGGESKFPTNINYLLEEYGIMINNDAVVRTAFYKYHHPKESCITSGVICKDIFRVMHGNDKKEKPKGMQLEMTKPAMTIEEHEPIPFVYPFGATLTVQKPEKSVAGLIGPVPILSSGPISYPINRPLAAVAEFHKQAEDGSILAKGRLLVFGSVKFFDDEYIEAEQNFALWNTLLKWAMRQNDLDLIKVEGNAYAEIEDHHYIPDTLSLAADLKSCLQESDPIPRDFTKMFDATLFGFDTAGIPECIRLYKELSVKHEPLTLVPPQFETPMPKLQPAVFPPTLNEPAPPALDLFDLDEHFASERVRLAQLTNKCDDKDLEFYIREAGDILGVTQKLGDSRDAKHVLTYLFNQLCNYKRLNFEEVRDKHMGNEFRGDMM